MKEYLDKHDSGKYELQTRKIFYQKKENMQIKNTNMR